MIAISSQICYNIKNQLKKQYKREILAEHLGKIDKSFINGLKEIWKMHYRDISIHGLEAGLAGITQTLELWKCFPN